MEERPFTERFKEIMMGLKNNPGSYLYKVDVELMWACAKEIEAMRQEINELKQQLNK